VPELSRFFGIVIRMFVEAGGQHHRPHFHAYYQDDAAVFAVDTIDCLGGSLPKAAIRPATGQDRSAEVGPCIPFIG
jgi:hypothetical protein